VCGVDMLRSNHGPVIMEVNSSPGLEGIELASGKDIADLIIQFIEKRFESLEVSKDKSAVGMGTSTRTRTRGKG
jgi:ribosomal protein S6--L-glutamate ligase